jgi:signal transduction histidine kinase
MHEEARVAVQGLPARVRTRRVWERERPVSQWLAERQTTVGLVAVALAALAVWVTARADFLAYPGWLAVQKADMILGPVLVGLYWLRRRPESRFGPLLIATGLVGCAPYLLQSSSQPVLFATGVLWEGAVYLSALALILTFPTGRLDGTAARAIFATGLVAVVVNSAIVLLAPQLAGDGSISDCRSTCPHNGLRLFSNQALAVDLVRVTRIVIVVLALATIALIVWRVVTGTRPRRRALAIGAPVALAFLVSQAAYQGSNLLGGPQSDFYPAARWTIVGTRSAIWYGFFFALIAAELFAGRMLRRVVSESLRRPAPTELEAMLRGPLGDQSLRLAFRQRGTDTWVDAHGEVLESPAPASGRVLTEVARDGRAAAAIVHDPQLAEEPELLQAAGAIVLLVQENAELDAGWTASLDDLRDSRRRIVAASEAERRRLERDLHDGAQQRLVSLRIHLAIASEQVTGDPATRAKLVEMEGEVDAVIEELRDLAHGIFPSLLADRGLLPALRAVGLRRPRAIEVTGRRIGRYPPEIESAVYYCCLEAVQNATKHAGPSAHIVARLSAAPGELRLEVRDDGPGFDLTAVNGGVGLHNMEDRLGAVHGRLEIVTSPGDGTVVFGTVPIDGTAG